jgi:dihydropteroate synthase
VVVNDVSGGLADPQMRRVVADAGCPYVLMHWRGHADHMTDFATYDNPGGVVAAVRDELAERVDAALAAGVAAERLVLDPGLGFAKHGDHNWQLLADLGPIKALGYPLLVGASRKSFLGTLLADADGNPRPVDGREDATTALSVLLAGEGVWGLRVHDVRSTRDALRVLQALETAREEGET